MAGVWKCLGTRAASYPSLCTIQSRPLQFTTRAIGRQTHHFCTPAYYACLFSYLIKFTAILIALFILTRPLGHKSDMAAEQRKLLEQLMGEQLLSGPSQSSTKVAITDAKVCRSYLVGTCPHDLFTNTKQDIGPCPKVHNEALKNEYADASDDQKRKWGFQFDYLRDMAKFVNDCDRRIEAATRRLERTAEEGRVLDALLKQIASLTETYNCSLLEVRIMAEEGAVNTAVMEHWKLNAIRIQLAEKERELKALSDTSGPSGHQKLQVCDVCGAYLSRLDNDRRLADHFYGKMHLGYAQMRKTYKQLQQELKGMAPPQRDFEGLNGPRGDSYGDTGYGDRGYGGRGGHRGGGGYGRGGGGFRGRGGYGRW